MTNTTATTRDRPDANGHLPDEPGYNPFNTVAAAKKRAAKREGEDATQKLVKRWAVERFGIDELTKRPERWARDVVRNAARKAATGAAKHAPELMITGDKLVGAGATDAELRTLTALSAEDITALSIESAAWRMAYGMQARDRASIIVAEAAAADVVIPGRVDLSEYELPEVTWAIDNMLAQSGVLGLFAERKAGKSTVVCDLVGAGVDERRFLGKFRVRLAAGAEVVLFDTEMPVATIHRQYQRAGVKRLDRLNLRALRGAERSLDVRVDAVRERWRKEIVPGSLIIVDCLYSLFGALGISESSEDVVPLLTGLRALAAECEAAGLVVVHHLGKDADKGARGHSSLEGFPDVLARIEIDGTPDGSTPRTFSAFGRDGVSVDAGTLTLDENGHLMLGASLTAERTALRHQADNTAVWELIDAHPGQSVRGLLDLQKGSRSKLSRDRITAALGRLESVSRAVNKGTNAAPEWHALTDVDPFSGGVQACA
ncbi:AAA family ATPase [Mycolicibacterium sp. 22603]|uniref:AAA family ATPase n=1 Tax=Mycolicibacterium sp. 22603 TaxID=3453950 RepID=UPI003F854D35